jgi:threonine dehydrogenase-like Zn-dependent dehydrogenase
MRALTVTPGVKNSIRLEDIDKPTPSESQALLRVQEIGICGTDLDINQGFYGEAPPGSNYLVIGHESLVTVESIPGSVHGISKGDLVVPTVRRPDSCMNCLNGESDMCLTGNYREHGIKRLHGFGSELAVSDVDFLVKVPSKLADVAVLLEPMSVAEKGVYQAFKIQERMLWKPKRVLILGAGPVGLLTTYLLRLKGLEVVVTATRAKDSAKARLAQRAGAVYINTIEQPLQSLGKFDLIMEETGVAQVAMQATGMLNRNGIMCFLGIYSPTTAPEDIGEFYKDVVLGNKTFFGSVNANINYFRMGLKDFAEIENRFDGILRDTISARISPEEFQKAYAQNKDNIKTVIRFNNQ